MCSGGRQRNVVIGIPYEPRPKFAQAGGKGPACGRGVGHAGPCSPACSLLGECAECRVVKARNARTHAARLMSICFRRAKE